MRKIAQWAIPEAAGALALVFSCPGAAQNASPPAAIAAPAADSALAAGKAAFESMPEADRRIVQDALVWLGLYVGTVDGAFGKRTRDSIVAWQTSVKAPPNGIVDAAQLATLRSVLQKEQAAVGFQSFIDAHTGVKIGAPIKILDKRSQSGADSVLSKADGTVTLVLHANSGAASEFSALYAQLTADAPGRKIMYKASKPDSFFVVSGEEAGRKFYTRIAREASASSDAVARRGFTFAYPAAQSATLDRIALAIADSFAPFPAAAGATVAGAALAAPPPPPPAPRGPTLAATGFAVAPGQAVSAIGAAECADPTIDGKTAKFIREDTASGLSLLGGDFGPGVSAPVFGALGADMVAMSFEQDKPGAPTLIVATAQPLAVGDAGPQVLAPLSKSGAGSPLFDRTGALAAIVGPIAGASRSIGGATILAAHRAVDAETLRKFLTLEATSQDNAGAPMIAGQVVAARRGGLVAIYCRR
jgi:peptidoglycan hydrolase-like protein with peptidoglycan-binding domain